MEKQFLLYVLYITLVELRERALEQNDKRAFGLTNLLHNVPLTLSHEELILDGYNELIEKAHACGADQWLENRKSEFIARYPQFQGRL